MIGKAFVKPEDKKKIRSKQYTILPEMTKGSSGNITHQFTGGGRCLAVVDGNYVCDVPTDGTVFTGYLPSGSKVQYLFEDFDKLTHFRLTNGGLSCNLWNFPDAPALRMFDVYNNNFGYTGMSNGFFSRVNSNITTVNFVNNNLDFLEVDYILHDLNTSYVWGTYVDVSGTNAAPQSTGLTAKYNLEGRYCNVVVTTDDGGEPLPMW